MTRKKTNLFWDIRPTPFFSKHHHAASTTAAAWIWALHLPWNSFLLALVTQSPRAGGCRNFRPWIGQRHLTENLELLPFGWGCLAGEEARTGAAAGAGPRKTHSVPFARKTLCWRRLRWLARGELRGDVRPGQERVEADGKHDDSEEQRWHYHGGKHDLCSWGIWWQWIPEHSWSLQSGVKRVEPLHKNLQVLSELNPPFKLTGLVM